MNRIITLALAALVLLVMSGTANAWNSKSYNGSSCKPWWPAYGGDDLIALPAGLYNVSSSTVYITCPLIVDETSNNQGTYWVGFWWTDVFDLGQSISCNISSIGLDGVATQTLSVQSEYDGWVTLPNITEEYFSSSYVISCALPGLSVMNGILVYEQN